MKLVKEKFQFLAYDQNTTELCCNFTVDLASAVLKFPAACGVTKKTNIPLCKELEIIQQLQFDNVDGSLENPPYVRIAAQAEHQIQRLIGFGWHVEQLYPLLPMCTACTVTYKAPLILWEKMLQYYIHDKLHGKLYRDFLDDLHSRDLLLNLKGDLQYE